MVALGGLVRDGDRDGWTRLDDAARPPRDLRFLALLGPPAWARLPCAVRERFSRPPANGAVTYVGTIVESRHSRIGWLVAQACRLIGAPLPLGDDLGAPAVVSVTEDAAADGQFWTRIYGRRLGFPQVIHSSKRFAGPTGLEEYVGAGFGIALSLSADDRALRFHADHYFLRLSGWRIRVPRWLEPGALTVGHIDRGAAGFAFVLTLRHPRFGELIRQTCLFRERRSLDQEDIRHD